MPSMLNWHMVPIYLIVSTEMETLEKIAQILSSLKNINTEKRFYENKILLSCLLEAA